MSLKQKCQQKSCSSEGLYKAPKYRNSDIKDQHDWIWLCKQHVREYNSNWNYYQGMNEDEIYYSWKQGIVGDRPTFHLLHMSYKSKIFSNIEFQRDEKNDFITQESSYIENKRLFDPNVRKALSFFNLSPSYTKEELMLSYRNYVKKYHPDHNQGDQKSSEMLKMTIEHFKILDTF